MSTKPDPALTLPVVDQAALPCVALLGNPNAGKTSLFNRLTGLRAHTANFPGTTVEHRRARIELGGAPATLIDLPGVYSLEPSSPDEAVAVAVLRGEEARVPRPDALVVVVDSTNLERNLPLVSQALELGLPTIVALNLTDLADRLGVRIDLRKLSQELGCTLVAVSARTGSGIPELQSAITALLAERPVPVSAPHSCACTTCGGCGYTARFHWAEGVTRASVVETSPRAAAMTDALDTLFTHPVIGLGAFALVMTGFFVLVFWVAQFPMAWMDAAFAWAGGWTQQVMPPGVMQSFVADGVIGGVGGMLIFLPQICLLFFALALLEDSGYLSRASLVMDKLMRRVGLPGKAFVPMLSAHACAIPAIMASRVIEDRRDRLVTIMVLPLLTCSARVPVYALMVGLLFPGSPLTQAAVFAGCYALGAAAAFGMAWVFRKTILKGQPRPLVIELPNYRRPSLRDALLVTMDRAWAFIRNAGTTILLICLVMWALATFPRTPESELPSEVQAQVAQLRQQGDDPAAQALIGQAQLERSFAGAIGRFVQPVFDPLGFDWRMSIGVVSSFAAREAIVSSLSVLYGMGDDGADDQPSLLAKMRAARGPGGGPAFNVPTCLSLLVFYVLAMQCLPTQAVTWRETGTWTWPALQLAYMSVLAYVAAWGTHAAASALLGA
ncbi:Ferrous iron transport protein B [Pirellulimonas nuda]|uniref:Ferrous iron transport protein B n=1 Tax=Pirellulimonas nuda TaxID=2528009 RepID=A0A518DJK0_9BACT|nr:ferrous iron transporter B [Pirellulimonas nuda]QDU91653.1 Ferrous iron transport protein B [Pirellulimonas nuda]